MQSIPFKTDDVHGGLTEAAGFVYVDGEDLVLEVETAFLGAFQRKTRVFRIDLTDLDEVAHKRTLRGDQVTIRTRPLDRIREVPGAKEGALRLRIRRKHRPALADLLDRLYLWRSEV